MTEPNVITALAKVQAEIGGIGKKRPEGAQLSYAYRGIDAISAAAQPLLGEAGVVIVPSEGLIVSVVEIMVGSPPKPWTDTTVNVLWTIYGPGGVEDCITARTQGLGRDNSDKGYNKAMTGAFKNLLLRLLCIGDPQDDADAPQHQNNLTEPRERPQADPKRQPLSMPIDALIARLGRSEPDVKAKVEAEAAKYNQTLDAPAFEADHEWANYVYSLITKAAA